MLNFLKSKSKKHFKIWDKGSIIENKYLVKDIAHGRMGIIYFVKHLEWNIDLAVKSPNKEVLKHRGGREQFILEAQSWILLGKHPNIITAYYVKTIEDIPYIFMEYAEGKLLSEILDKKRIKSYKEILDITIQIVDAMIHSHNKGIIHRDLKVENCFISENENNTNTIKLTDFGLVKAISYDAVIKDLCIKSNQNTDTIYAPSMFMAGKNNVVMGTPAYMAPEMWGKAHKAGKEADIYAFGIILFEIICGKRPYYTELPQDYRQLHLKSRIPNPKEYRDDIPEKLSQMIIRCLEKKIEDRYSDFIEIKKELQEVYYDLYYEKYKSQYETGPILISDDLNNQALSLFDLGEKNKAIELLKDLTDNDFSHFSSHINLALMLWNENIVNSEVLPTKLINRAINNNPILKGEGYYYRALFETELDNHIQALNSIDKCFSLNYENSKVYNLKGIILSAFKKYNEAIKSFEKALESDNLSYEYLNNLLVIKKRNNDLKEYKTLEKKLIKHPDYKKADKALSEKTVIHIEELDYNDELKNTSIIKNSCLENYVISTNKKNSIYIWNTNDHTFFNRLDGHTDKINHVIINNNKTIAISASNDYTIRVWNLKTNECLRILKRHNHNVNYLAFNKNEDKFISASDDKTICIWDLSTLNNIGILEGHTSFVTKIISLDNSKILSISHDHTIRIWNIDSKECIRILKAHKTKITDIVLNDDNSYAYSISIDGNICIWNLLQFSLLKSLDNRYQSTNKLCLSKNSRYLVTSSLNKIIVWNLEENICQNIFEGYEYTISDFSISTTNDWIYSISKNGNIRIWDIKKNRCIKIHDTNLELQYLFINDLLFVSTVNETIVFNQNIDNINLVYKMNDYLVAKIISVTDEISLHNQIKHTIEDIKDYVNKKNYEYAYDKILSLQKMKKTKYVKEIQKSYNVLCHELNIVKLNDVFNIFSIKTPKNNVKFLRIDNQNNLLYVILKNDIIEIWNVIDFQLTKTININTESIIDLKIIKNKTYLINQFNNNYHISINEIDTSNSIGNINNINEKIIAIEFLRNNEIAMILTDNGIIYIWDLKHSKNIMELNNDDVEIEIDFYKLSLSKKYLVYSDTENKIYIFNIQNFSFCEKLKGYIFLDITKNDEIVLYSEIDKKLFLYNIQNHNLKCIIENIENSITKAIYNSKKNTLITLNKKNIITFYHVCDYSIAKIIDYSNIMINNVMINEVNSILFTKLTDSVQIWLLDFDFNFESKKV